MADFRLVRAVSSVTRGTDDDQWMALRGTRDGSAFTADWLMALALEGRMFVVNLGTATTPIDLAKTAYDADQPQLVVDVPVNTTIVPVYLEIYLEDSAGTNTEAVWSVSTGAIGAGTSTALTPASSKVDGDISTTCSVYSVYTGNGTAPVAGFEFARFGYPHADATTDPAKKFMWSLYQSSIVPVIVGTGALVLHADGTTTAPAGFVTAAWVEFPSNQV